MADTPDPDLTDLFLTPQITTDADGVHRDEFGRLYDAVIVDGEVTFRLRHGQGAS